MYTSLFFIACNIINFFTIKKIYIEGITIIIMVLSILFSMIYMIIPVLPSKRRGHSKKDPFTLGLGIFTLVVLPLMFIIDLFPNLFSFGSYYKDHFLVIPGFYLLLNLGLIFSLRGKFWSENTHMDTFIEMYSISPREKGVIELLITGESYQGIADRLYISLSTVKTHISNIYQKTNTSNKVELISLIHRKT